MFALLLAALFICGGCANARTKRVLIDLPPQYQRICALGDSITDGFSYPLMVRAALSEAGYNKPYMICAGVASDVTAQMLARLDRDVFAYHPTCVTLLGGTNDANRGVTPDQYAANVTAIADRCDKEHVKFIILTAPIFGPKSVANEPIIDQYNAWIKTFAAQRGYPVADSNALMKADRAAGNNPIEGDNIHPNYLGHQDMTRALLDAMGYKDVPLVKVWAPEVMPGIIKAWKVRATPADMKGPITAAQAASIAPDNTWKTITVPVRYELPNPLPAGAWWPQQERQRGFVGPLATLVGPSATFQSVATYKVDNDDPTSKYLNVGAAVNGVWLNGVKVYTVGPWTGWHVGHDRVKVTLNRGDNTILVESGDPFFISLTDSTDVGP